MVTHALQGECKTYRGCQSSGVTDSDSERQHEINMAVQTVQGRGHTDCQEGGTEIDMHLHRATFTCPPSQNTTRVHCWVGLHSVMQDFAHIHSLIFTHIQNPAVHEGVLRAISLFTHHQLLLILPPSWRHNSVHTSRDPKYIHTSSAWSIPRSQHQAAGHRWVDLSH